MHSKWSRGGFARSWVSCTYDMQLVGVNLEGEGRERRQYLCVVVVDIKGLTKGGEHVRPYCIQHDWLIEEGHSENEMGSLLHKSTNTHTHTLYTHTHHPYPPTHNTHHPYTAHTVHQDILVAFADTIVTNTVAIIHALQSTFDQKLGSDVSIMFLYLADDTHLDIKQR